MREMILMLLGVLLIVVGLVFAVRGFGNATAGGSATKAISLTGPAWLILVGIGAALVVFAVVHDDGNGPETPRTVTEPSTTTTAAPTTTTVRPSLHAALDALHVRCATGEMLACDDLVDQAADGSVYNNFGRSCGGRTLEADWRRETGTCVATLGLTG